ncbi:class I glutamine amidotransferase-like protein [Suillus paluster]|uniref:class I glutamine amidotransferase-like protein n=1 Tax=Suillus paluster TaxID=48578 RepID=UPI001B87C839|nr:class I glutamine amidotransferase-like protein [Suillus paluster]KAG1733884.1 class I glutamine amidotransferase-like protein [Suillus paluster]
MYKPETHRRIALLVCDVPADAIRERHGDYTRIFGTLLEVSLKPINETRSADSQATFKLEPFDVRAQVYPKDVDEYDAILITGSVSTAHEYEQPGREWIKKLIEYVRVVATEKPWIKIFGICFGHQIVALAMGGTCVRNMRFEVSATKLQLTELGKRVYGVESGILNIHLMNRDHVPNEPPSFHILSSSNQSPNHGMVLFSDSEFSEDAPPSNFSLTDIHILTSQGHPEFTESIMHLLLRIRRELLGPELVRDGESRAGNQNDGVAVIGKAIWGVMGVE